MKKFNFFSVLSLALILSVAVSCSSGSKKDMIAKKWQLDAFDMGKEVSEEEQAKMDQMIEKMKESSYYHFKKDGTYEIKTMGQTEKGEWKLNDDKSVIITTPKEGKESKVDIKELNGSQLVLSREERGEKIEMTLIPAS